MEFHREYFGLLGDRKYLEAKELVDKYYQQTYDEFRNSNDEGVKKIRVETLAFLTNTSLILEDLINLNNKQNNIQTPKQNLEGTK